MVVSIAEDATAIVGRREYGIKSNSVIGFSLPLEINGLPDSSLSKVKTAEDIINMFASFERATNVMVIMAQPLAKNVSPIRILSFGTNNKFTADDVKNRVTKIETELNNAGIKVLSYSADGDSRELKMMRQTLQLGVSIPKIYHGPRVTIYLNNRKFNNFSQFFTC